MARRQSLPPCRVHTARIATDVLLSAWAYGCYAWAVFVALLLACGGLVILLQRPAPGRRIARFGARLLSRLTGVPISAKGIDRLPRQPHMLLVNHASYLDAIALAALLPAVPGYAFTANFDGFAVSIASY